MAKHQAPHLLRVRAVIGALIAGGMLFVGPAGIALAAPGGSEGNNGNHGQGNNGKGQGNGGGGSGNDGGGSGNDGGGSGNAGGGGNGGGGSGSPGSPGNPGGGPVEPGGFASPISSSIFCEFATDVPSCLASSDFSACC